ncbi:MAG: hypothetical protein ACRDS9_09450 [Pseudonocardiaceae bacterium]
MSGDPGFSADLDALRSASGGIADVLATPGAQVDHIDCDPVSFGHDRLAGTTKHFCDRWQEGIRNLVQDGQQIADRLVRTVDGYSQADTSARDALKIVASGRGAGNAAL